MTFDIFCQQEVPKKRIIFGSKKTKGAKQKSKKRNIYITLWLDTFTDRTSVTSTFVPYTTTIVTPEWVCTGKCINHRLVCLYLCWLNIDILFLWWLNVHILFLWWLDIYIFLLWRFSWNSKYGLSDLFKTDDHEFCILPKLLLQIYNNRVQMHFHCEGSILLKGAWMVIRQVINASGKQYWHYVEHIVLTYDNSECF